MGRKKLHLKNVEDTALPMEILQSNVPFPTLTGDVPIPKCLKETFHLLASAFFLILDNDCSSALPDYIAAYSNTIPAAQACFHFIQTGRNKAMRPKS